MNKKEIYIIKLILLAISPVFLVILITGLFIAEQMNKFSYILIIILILIISIALFKYVYYHIIKLRSVLKSAMNDMISGNLQYEVKSDKSDGFTEFFEDFEKLRLWLNALLIQQEENDSITREVIGNISHDLKTPLTAIKGYAEGILDGIASSPERIERYVQTIYTKASDMSLLVDELSFFNNINQQDVEYNFSIISINDYISECVGNLISDLEMKKIHLLFRIYIERDVKVRVDVDKFKRVINNIIGNAGKYIDHEHGIILVKICKENDNIIISFEDNGVGIEDSELPYIFDRFYRADSSRNSKTGGTGVGLAIAKKIVKDHGGKIWAESNLGKGTTLLIRLKEFCD